MSSKKFRLSQFPAHLGRGASIYNLPEFTGDPSWYEAYAASVASDGAEGRLVSMHSFDAAWDSWEMHPNGAELVVCVAGTMTLFQEREGAVVSVVLEAGEAIVNEPGVWHTADVEASATALFITAGLGTEIRPR